MCGVFSKKFIPELHDIGKLVDDRVKEEVKNKKKISWKGHVFVDFDFKSFGISQPTSPSWWGQYHHICYDNSNKKWVTCDRKKLRKGLHTSIDEIDINNWNIIPQNFRSSLFLLILADHLASSVSRAVGGRGPKSSQKGIYKLWNKNFYKKKKGKQWTAFRTIDDLKNMFNEIENCQSGEEFLNKYRENLLLTPEDKSVPRNVTSLYTHAELVGKIYRVLEKNTRVITEPNGVIAIEYNGEKVRRIKEAEGGGETVGSCNNNWDCVNCAEYNSCNIAKGRWQARLIKCWIKFPHSFVRLQDINLLKKREELVNCIASYYKDEVIFATSDFITLFLPPNQDLKEILKPLLDWGFYIEAEETLADLGILNSRLDRKTLQARKCVEEYEKREKCKKKPKEEFENQLNVLNSRGTKVYRRYLIPEIPDEVGPYICDICQQRKAIKRNPESKEDSFRDWVCEKCLKIREMGEPFKKYGEEWDKEGVKVCWFKFSLDQNKLEIWLQKAFERYINKIIENVESELQNIQRKINEKLSIQQKKEQERKELIKSVKSSTDEEKRRKIGQEIKKISDEIKNIASDIRGLEEKKKSLENEKNELEKSKDEFRPLALQVDFNKDYKEMLKEFWKKLSEKLSDEEKNNIELPIKGYYELGVFKYSPQLAQKIIETFLDVFEEYFPDCISNESSPISLSLSIANIKYPIREHWRFFEENNRNFLNVRYHKVFEEKYTRDELKAILEKAINVKTPSSFLHKLVQVEERLQSEIHIAVEIFNNRGRNECHSIYELFSKGIKPSKFLNLYKLLKGEEK